MSIPLGRDGWPLTREQVKKRKAADLPTPPVVEQRIEIIDGQPWLVKVYAMAHEADMLKGNEDVK